MTRIHHFFILIAMGAWANMANGAGLMQWWTQADICRPNPTKCYIGMGMGFEPEMWDNMGNCWGMKLICPDALTTPASAPTPMTRSDIEQRRGIKADFDTTILNGDCYGMRRSSADGAQVMVDGKLVNVWCNGILDRVDEVVPSGEITLGEQPKCRDLAPNGWVAIANQRCYGKYYDPSQYYIECNDDSPLPSRIIVLNGANYSTGTDGSTSGADAAATNKLFDKMITVSSEQRDKYYNKK